MKPDQHLEHAEKSLLAAGARQYVKSAVLDTTEDLMRALESDLGGKTISVEGTFATLGGIMAMRRLLRRVDTDIRRGQDSNTPPSR